MMDKTLNAFIVDDEKPAREELVWLLQQCDDVRIAGQAENTTNALAAIDASASSDPVDLVFLDIDMPGIAFGKVQDFDGAAHGEARRARPATFPNP